MAWTPARLPTPKAMSATSLASLSREFTRKRRLAISSHIWTLFGDKLQVRIRLHLLIEARCGREGLGIPPEAPRNDPEGQHPPAAYNQKISLHCDPMGHMRPCTERNKSVPNSAENMSAQPVALN